MTLTLRHYHASAATLALALILSFWLSTISVELLASHHVIYLVKRSILFAMALLIPCIMWHGSHWLFF